MKNLIMNYLKTDNIKLKNVIEEKMLSGLNLNIQIEENAEKDQRYNLRKRE